MKKSDSRGLSTIVTTLLILLLIFVAIGIIWVVVRNVIQQGSEQISLGKFTLDLEIKSVVVGTDSVNVKVKRNPGAGEISGLKFIVDDGDTTKVIEKNGTLSELQEKTFIFSSGELGDIVVANIEKVSVAPIFTLESGKEYVGDVKDEYEISGTGGGGTQTECSDAGDCDDSNACTTDTCPSGTCVHTAVCVSDGTCCSGCSNDPDCADCSVPSECGQDSTEDICLSGDVYTRTITWSCDGTCHQNVNDVLSEGCDDGDSCTADSCPNDECVNTLICSSDGQCCSECSDDPDCGGTPIKYEFFSETGNDWTQINGAQWRAQAFTIGTVGTNEAFTITSVKLQLYRLGNPGTLTVSIRAVDGEFPTGSDLSTGTIDGNSFVTSGSGDLYEIDMSAYELQASTKYALVLRATSGDTSNYVRWLQLNPGTYSGGRHSYSVNSGSSWTSDNADQIFEIWGY